MQQDYQKQDCRFCQIASRKVEDYLVWQNVNFSLILDNHAVRKGHCMLIPNWHVESVYDLNNEQTAQLFNTAKRISFSLLDYTLAKKIGMLIKGFKISHAHLHLIPLENEGQNLEEGIIKMNHEELMNVLCGLRERISKE